jgi:DNA-binding NarL/FixJ family response regulator
MNNIKVLVVSDVPFFLDGIKAFLKTKYTNVISRDHTEIIENIKLYSPGIVILDDSFGDINSFARLISDIAKNNPGIKIMVYTENKHTACLRELIDAGIKALLYTKGEKELLYEALKQVEKGKIHFDGYFNSAVFMQEQDEEIKKENLIKLLSKREKEILKLLSKGLKNKEMADILCISHYTIEKHKTNIRKKFGLKSSTELTVFVARNYPDES